MDGFESADLSDLLHRDIGFGEVVECDFEPVFQHKPADGHASLPSEPPAQIADGCFGAGGDFFKRIGAARRGVDIADRPFDRKRHAFGKNRELVQGEFA